MRIAVLCFHSLGGSGVVAGEIARGLAARGHAVHVVGAALPARLAAGTAGISLHAVPVDQPPPRGGSAWTVALAVALIDVIRRERIELLHAHYAIPHAAAAALARNALGPAAPPLVLTLHGSDVPAVEATQGEVLLVRSLVLGADAVTVPSDALARLARSRLGLPEDALLRTLPNPVDTGRFSPGEGQSTRAALFPGRDLAGVAVLGHASNFRPVKRPLDLVEILARVRKTRPAVLVLAGDGPERARVEADVQRRGLAAEVAFAGAVADVAPLLRACDLFLLPSEHESFGLAALEAMSCGVPVIASRTGGLPEVVAEGETGLLLPVGDVAGMAAASLRLLADGQARRAMGAAARERALRTFHAGPVLERWEELYAGVAARSLRSRRHIP